MRNSLNKLRNLALQNGEGLYGNLEIALADIDAILSAEDLSKKSGSIRLLIAPTSNLQDLSIDCGWREEFLLLANKIENGLDK